MGLFAAARLRLSRQPAQQSEALDYLGLQSSSDVLLADIGPQPFCSAQRSYGLQRPA